MMTCFVTFYGCLLIYVTRLPYFLLVLGYQSTDTLSMIPET